MIKKVLFSITFVLLGVMTAAAQTTEEQLAECSQFLDKSIAEVRACKDLNLAKDELIATLRESLATEKQKNAVLEEINKLQDKQLTFFREMKCNEIQFRPLFFTIWRKKTCF